MTTGELQDRGSAEVFKNGRGVKATLEKLRKYVAKQEPGSIFTASKRKYRHAVTGAVCAGLKHDKKKTIDAWNHARLHSLNPEKAARVQAIREAWANTQARKANDQA